MKRWVIRVVMVVLTLLCAGAGWMEIDSYRQISQLRVARWSNTLVAADSIESRGWYGYIRSSRGKVALMSLSIEGRWRGEVREEVRRDSDGKTHYDWHGNEWLGTARKPEWMMVPKGYGNRGESLGFSYGRLERRGRYYMGNAPNEVSVIRLVLVPWPAVVVMLGIGPVWWSSRKVFRWGKRKRRVSMGLCGECGYDLRGSGEKCPECGGVGTGGARGMLKSIGVV